MHLGHSQTATLYYIIIHDMIELNMNDPPSAASCLVSASSFVIDKT